MTEIPEHLSKRAKEARKNAEGFNNPARSSNSAHIPNLLSAGQDSSTPVGDTRSGGWTEFGDRSRNLAAKVFEILGNNIDHDGYTAVSQRLGNTNDYRERYTMSQLVRTQIGEGVYLRIGHILSLEVDKPLSTRIVHGMRNITRDVLENGGNRVFYGTPGADTSKQISIEDFIGVSEAEDVRKTSQAWAEITIGASDPLDKSKDILTAFSLRITGNPIDGTSNLDRGYWGSSAQVIHPLEIDDSTLRHVGYRTHGAFDVADDDGKLTHSRNPFSEFGTTRWVGGKEVKWEVVSEDATKRPSFAAVVSTAMQGLDVSLAIMQDTNPRADLLTYDTQLHAALANLR